MYEINKRTAGTLSAMRPDLEYIPVCSDPRGVRVSELHKEGAILKEIHIRIERQNTLYNAMEQMMCVCVAACPVWEWCMSWPDWSLEHNKRSPWRVAARTRGRCKKHLQVYFRRAGGENQDES